MVKTEIEELKEKYGFSKSSLKYVPAGGEILKYTDVEVVFVEFKKQGGDWTNIVKTAVIKEISDFDPMTVTYNCKYRIIGEDSETQLREVRIIPEGFSFNPADTEGWMCRFLPMSLHCKLVEDESFNWKVTRLYSKRDTIPVSGLETISASKEQDKTLGYSCNLGAAIKLSTDNSILWFRIKRLSIRHEFKNNYSLRIEDQDGKAYTLKITSDQKEYNFCPSKNQIGFLKIIDLKD